MLSQCNPCHRCIIFCKKFRQVSWWSHLLWQPCVVSQHCEPGDCKNKETHEGTKNRLRSNGWDHFSTATLSYDMQFLIWWHHSLGPLKESVGISQAYKPEQKNRHQSCYTFEVTDMEKNSFGNHSWVTELLEDVYTAKLN